MCYQLTEGRILQHSNHNHMVSCWTAKSMGATYREWEGRRQQEEIVLIEGQATFVLDADDLTYV
jgi:hypothetical protein